MRISFNEQVEGGRVIQSIGRVRAATSWHAPGATCATGDWRAEALRALVSAAEDYEADAVIGVGYELDDVASIDLARIDLQRVTATGIAVKLARG
jgi:Putative heavy-metal-binding